MPPLATPVALPLCLVVYKISPATCQDLSLCTKLHFQWLGNVGVLFVSSILNGCIFFFFFGAYFPWCSVFGRVNQEFKGWQRKAKVRPAAETPRLKTRGTYSIPGHHHHLRLHAGSWRMSHTFCFFLPTTVQCLAVNPHLHFVPSTTRGLQWTHLLTGFVKPGVLVLICLRILFKRKLYY